MLLYFCTYTCVNDFLLFLNLHAYLFGYLGPTWLVSTYHHWRPCALPLLGLSIWFTLYTYDGRGRIDFRPREAIISGSGGAQHVANLLGDQSRHNFALTRHLEVDPWRKLHVELGGLRDICMRRELIQIMRQYVVVASLWFN